MQENPTLVACKPLKIEFDHLKEIHLDSEEFSIGRGLNNMAVIPFLAISRNHCKFLKQDSDWLLEDYSTFGIVINGDKLGKGNKRILNQGDIIELDQCQEFIYKFNYEDADFLPPSRKRIKLEVCPSNNNLLNNVKSKFEEFQHYEKKHIEDKIENTKQIITTNLMLKEQLETDMKRKINLLENEFTCQIENLKGEKDEVESQKSHLIEKRNLQLSALKSFMNEKLEELKVQINSHNETETNLLLENNLLKKKLEKEKQDYLSELNKETSSKKEMLERLVVKIKEQEEIRNKEKQEFEKLLSKETESLKLAKEEELNELAQLKSEKELQLVAELNSMKKSLEDQVESTVKQKTEALQQLNDQVEQMKKLKAEDNIKMEQLIKAREEIQKRLNEAQKYAEVSIEKLKTRVTEREIELAALAAERIQKQAEQSSEVINSLQEQLERVRNKLQSVETENKKLQEQTPGTHGEGTSKDTIAEFGEIMESELQCSICAELFVSATTLNCSHTFCKYCITMWMKKKKECAICRAPITSECKSIVLDSFIEKMLLSLSEEMKQKRKDLLKSRNELICELERQETSISHVQRRSLGSPRSPSASLSSSGRGDSHDEDSEEIDNFFENESEEDYAWEYDYNTYDSDSGSDDMNILDLWWSPGGSKLNSVSLRYANGRPASRGGSGLQTPSYTHEL